MKNTIKIGLFGIGLDSYWSQFDGLLEKLGLFQSRIKARLEHAGSEVTYAGISLWPGNAKSRMPWQ